MTDRRQTRRSFLQNTAGAIAAASWAGVAIGAKGSPNEMLHVAAVGVGGKGRSDLGGVAAAGNVRVVALCDVDANNLGAAAAAFPEAKTFRDYRRVFDVMAKDIDAVICGTPDHAHGAISIAALSLDKHVFCEKPLAHNLLECRAMQRGAEKNKQLVTQMGTQCHSMSPYLTGVAAIRAGVIGKVREAHLWVSKSWSGSAEGRPNRTDPIPKHLDWDLWLGVAPERPYVAEIYHPSEWRQWIDFGTGTLGDMGCHIFDPIFSALELGPPTKVISRGPQHYKEMFAGDEDISYEFAGTKYTDGPITFRWTDGSARSRPDGSVPSRPDADRAQLPKGVSLPGAGSFLVGEKGVMVLPHYSRPKFYSQGEKMDVTVDVLPNGNHYHEWANACRGEGTASTPFSYACPVTEAVLTGTIAGRFRDRQLAWNSDELKFDDEEANQFVRRTYRSGWEIDGLVEV